MDIQLPGPGNLTIEDERTRRYARKTVKLDKVALARDLLLSIICGVCQMRLRAKNVQGHPYFKDGTVYRQVRPTGRGSNSTSLKDYRVTTSSKVVLRTVPIGRLGSYQIREHLAWPASSFIPPASRLAGPYPTS